MGVADLQRERLPDATRKLREAVALGPFVEDVEERGHEADALSADIDAQLEREPVGLLLLIDPANVRVERWALLDDLEGVARVNLDLPPELAELR